jgi:two-component system nitrogen regulation response regulator NtrX
VDVVTRLASLPWHGNCRELRNMVDRLIVMGNEAASAVIDSAAGPRAAKDGADSSAGRDGGRADDPTEFARVPIRAEVQYREARAAWLDAFEREYLRVRVAMADGNVARTAREIGIDRAYLIRMMKRHCLTVR